MVDLFKKIEKMKEDAVNDVMSKIKSMSEYKNISTDELDDFNTDLILEVEKFDKE
jgi:hypothetical protein